MPRSFLKVTKYLILLTLAITLNACTNQKKSLGASCLDHLRTTWDESLKDKSPQWFEEHKEFETCTSGQHQSPIDIDPAEIKSRDNYRIRYEKTAMNLVDNQHTIEFDYEPGSYLYLDGKQFMLKQFHFHSPSEHTVNGERQEMEVHLVHQDKHGQLAVIALLVVQGSKNKLINEIWKHLPHDKDKHHIYPKEKINIVKLLPRDKTAYYYSGSLTTPPCSESVLWLVLKTPIEFSRSELNRFHKFYNWNIRSIQEQ